MLTGTARFETIVTKSGPKEKMALALERKFGFPAEEQAHFMDLFFLQTLEAGEDWVSAGQSSYQLAFIVSGLMRVFYIDANGTETIEGFYDQQDLIGPISSMVTGDPCQNTMQAVESSVLLVADYRKLHQRGRDMPSWLRFEISFMQWIYLRSARRQAQLLLGSAARRYRWFCIEYPDLAQKLPQYHIAAYLGITPVSLSRLRNPKTSNPVAVGKKSLN